MFDRPLNPSWDDRSRRGLTTLTSFGLQAVAVGVLLVLPLIRPLGLPSFRQVSPPMSLGRPLGEPAPTRTHVSGSAAAPRAVADIVLTEPTQIPRNISSGGDDASAPETISGLAIPVAAGRGDLRGVRDLFANGSQPMLPAVRPSTIVAPVRISHMSEGNLIRRVQPTYPALARSARIQGAVVLQAVISKEGAIENLKVLSGHPMLVPAAIEAVKQWYYRPYILNNEPVEVETMITVNFSLNGN